MTSYSSRQARMLLGVALETFGTYGARLGRPGNKKVTSRFLF